MMPRFLFAMTTRAGTSQRTPEQIAEILYEVELYGSTRIAREHKISRVTIHDWRKRLETDDEVRSIFTNLMDERRSAWADRVDKPIHGAIDFITNAVEKLDAGNPESLQAVAQALKVLAEAKFASEVFNVFARKQIAGNDQAGRADAAGVSTSG